MKIVPADFNAMTEEGRLRLGFRDSQDTLRNLGIEVGDWMWLSDGEVLVGAQLASDARYGMVGIPRWKTLVHLDDEDSKDVSAVWKEFLELTRKPGRDPIDEARIFQLLTILDAIDPQTIGASIPPGYFALRRAGALHYLGEPALALLSLEEALRAVPADPELGVSAPSAWVASA
jgi:hypothetical protein